MNTATTFLPAKSLTLQKKLKNVGLTVSALQEIVGENYCARSKRRILATRLTREQRIRIRPALGGDF